MPLFNLSVGLCVRVCVTFVISTDHESYTRVISTNLGSMEVGEIKLTRENFFPRRPSRVRRGRRAAVDFVVFRVGRIFRVCLLYTSPSPRD